MLRNFIRAWNNKGKSFDISYQLGTGVLTYIKECAEQKIQLPETLRKTQPSLNEMYLSFMDPTGEIINFQFIEEVALGSFRIVHQMYFKTGEEKSRKLVFEYVGDWVIETNNGEQIIHKHTTEDKDKCSLFKTSWLEMDKKALNYTHKKMINGHGSAMKLSKPIIDHSENMEFTDFGTRRKWTKSPWHDLCIKTIDGK